MRVIGHVFVALATLVVGPVALVAALARPQWRAGLLERLTPPKRLDERPIWIHAASLGEAAAALPLIEAVRGSHPSLLLTTQTIAGRDWLRARCPDVACRLAPLDHPWLAGLAVRRVRSRALVLVETEVWPALVAAAERAGVPVVVVSGRLSDRAFHRQHEIAPFFTRTFARLTAVGARTEVDAGRFVKLGTPADRVQVTGDLKWAKSGDREPVAPEILNWMARRPTIVLGSVHLDEAGELLAAMRAVASTGREVQWLWAPRDLEAVEPLLRRFASEGVRARRRTALAAEASTDAERSDRADVVVLDTLGELPSVWPHGLIAVVGGTFGATGGHDPIEPLRAGRPVLVGPHTANVAEVVAALVSADAAIQVADGARLGAEIARLLDATRERADRVARGTALIEAGRAALDANVRLVLEAARASAAGRRALAPEVVATAAPSGLYARTGPHGAASVRPLSWLASAFYALGARIDRRTRRFGRRPARRLPCAVVSIGSWVVGGAAKTPATIGLARALRDRGHRVAVITRGHGVRLGRHRVEIASHGTGACARAALVGDEAVVIARETRGVPVLVSRDRHRAGMLAVVEFGCDVVLLDDAHQHYALHRDLDLVCLDAEIGLGNGRVLPAGPLRESKRSWKRADALIVTGGGLRAEDARLVDAHAPGLRRFKAERRVRGWRDLRSGKRVAPDALEGRTVGLLAALADPASVRALAERHGVDIGHALVRRDHHRWRRREIEGLGETNRLWITTEKDAAKIDPDWVEPGVGVYVLELDWVSADWPSLPHFVEVRCGLAPRAANPPRQSSDAAIESA